MTVKLKKGRETFQVVDGPDAGRTFERGVEYDLPPKGYESWFEEVKLGEPAVPKVTEPAASRKRSKKS